jgi:hypothetical protein
MAEVRPVRLEELPEVAALLGRVFGTDAMLTWTFPADIDREAATERFFATFHRAALEEGWIWVVGDGRIDGMVMWVPPDPEDRYGRMMAEMDDAVAEIMGERKPRRRPLGLDRRAPADATAPVPEHVAVGPRRSIRPGGLSRHGLGARREEVPGGSDLEAGNVPMYERPGFEVRRPRTPEQPHLWFMVRDPA